MEIRHVLALAAAFAGLSAQAGCGDDQTPTATATATATATTAAPVASSDRRAAVQAVRAWSTATSDRAACAQMSRGFATFAGDGDAENCARELKRTIGARRRPVTGITSVVVDQGQLAVTATTRAGSDLFYLVDEGGRWRINSLGARTDEMPGGAPPSP